MKKIIISMLFTLLSITNSQAKDNVLTSEDLQRACTIKDKEWIGFCNGYIQALVDANSGKNVCITPGTTRNQIFEILLPYLSLASNKNKDAFIVGSDAIRSSYGCN